MKLGWLLTLKIFVRILGCILLFSSFMGFAVGYPLWITVIVFLLGVFLIWRSGIK